MSTKPTTLRGRRPRAPAAAAIALLALLAVACGNKGDLVLPEEPPRAAAERP